MQSSDNLKVKCGDCGWEGVDADLHTQLGDLECIGERLDPGSEVPAGECPECRALAYVQRDDSKVRSTAAGLLVMAFAVGQRPGGKVDWDDVSAALEAAKRELGAEMVSRLEAECAAA